MRSSASYNFQLFRRITLNNSAAEWAGKIGREGEKLRRRAAEVQTFCAVVCPLEMEPR
jgi:hypothetical protein